MIDPTAEKELQISFVKALRKNVETASSYILKRVFGKRMNECNDLKPVIAYMTIAQDTEATSRRSEVWFLVAGAYYTLNNSHNQGTNYVRLQSLIGRAYANSSGSGKRKYEKLIDTDFASSIFFQIFAGITRDIKKYMRKGEVLDCLSLIQDLRAWDSPDRRVRIKWASEIVRNPHLSDNYKDETKE